LQNDTTKQHITEQVTSIKKHIICIPIYVHFDL
jgi:hypothetical protein